HGGDHGVHVPVVQHLDVVRIHRHTRMLLAGPLTSGRIDVTDGTESHPLHLPAGDEPGIHAPLGTEADDPETDVPFAHVLSRVGSFMAGVVCPMAGWGGVPLRTRMVPVRAAETVLPFVATAVRRPAGCPIATSHRCNPRQPLAHTATIPLADMPCGHCPASPTKSTPTSTSRWPPSPSWA